MIRRSFNKSCRIMSCVENKPAPEPKQSRKRNARGQRIDSLALEKLEQSPAFSSCSYTDDEIINIILEKYTCLTTEGFAIILTFLKSRNVPMIRNSIIVKTKLIGEVRFPGFYLHNIWECMEKLLEIGLAIQSPKQNHRHRLTSEGLTLAKQVHNLSDTNFQTMLNASSTNAKNLEMRLTDSASNPRLELNPAMRPILRAPFSMPPQKTPMNPSFLQRMEEPPNSLPLDLSINLNLKAIDYSMRAPQPPKKPRLNNPPSSSPYAGNSWRPMKDRDRGGRLNCPDRKSNHTQVPRIQPIYERYQEPPPIYRQLQLSYGILPNLAAYRSDVPFSDARALNFWKSQNFGFG